MPNLLDRRWPWGLIGMIGLVLVVEGFVTRRAVDVLGVDDWAYRQSLSVATHGAKRCDVLCFGDSLMKLGVIPRAVQARTGLRVFNLSVSGSQAPASYFLLRRAVDAGARPSAVLVDFHPTLQMVGPRHNLARWASLVGPSEAAQLAWWARDPDLFAKVMMGWALPSVYARDGLRAGLTDALAGKVNDQRWRNGLTFRNWNQNDGAQLHPANPALKGLSDEQVNALANSYYPAWKCDPVNDTGIDRFLALAASRGIPVYWVLPPLLPRVHRSLARNGFDAAHEAYIRSWQARYPDLIVIDGRRKQNDPDAFFDVNHLSAEGAYGFSLALGEVLRRVVPRGDQKQALRQPSRWVTMPETHPVALPPGVENIFQSESMLATGGRAQERR